MAQASGAQREPSMEEILASIRRIIEDSDTTQRTQGEAPVAANAAIETPRPSASVVDVDAFRAELRRAPEPQTELESEADLAPEAELTPASVPDVEPQTKPSSLADIQAFVASKGNEPAEPVAGKSYRDEPEAALPSYAVSMEEEIRAGLDFGDVEALQRAADETDASSDDDGEEDEAWHQPAAARTDIISEKTSRQVAASFGELSEAFASTRKKSFDEIAEAMMRPMLQDWLDNNLPLLVERLVREEIERVARGVR